MISSKERGTTYQTFPANLFKTEITLDLHLVEVTAVRKHVESHVDLYRAFCKYPQAFSQAHQWISEILRDQSKALFKHLLVGFLTNSKAN
jgi:hypothetical protein